MQQNIIIAASRILSTCKTKIMNLSHKPSYKHTDKITGCLHIYQKYVQHI